MSIETTTIATPVPEREKLTKKAITADDKGGSASPRAMLRFRRSR